MSKNHNKVIEKYIYSLVSDNDENSLAANIVDSVLIAFVLLSVFVAFISTFDLSPNFQRVLGSAEFVFVIFFTAEYLVRLWTSELMYPNLSPLRSRLRYMRSPMAIVDLLSILPFFLPIFGVSMGVLKIVRLVRLFRIFKINRYSTSLQMIGEVLVTKAPQLLSSILVIFILMFVAAMLMYDIEHIAQPEVFDNALSAMWWAMATVTTVGYGDIYPITTAGRMISAIITFLGIGLTAIPTAIISAGFIDQSNKMRKKHDKTCETCGQEIA